MAFSSIPTFEKRRRQIVRSHRSVTRRGGELHLGPDGLLTVRRKRGSTAIPYRGIFLIAALFFAAKSMMLAQDGAQTYGERVAKLAGGGQFEQAGAWLMQADPVTSMIASYIQPLLG